MFKFLNRSLTLRPDPAAARRLDELRADRACIIAEIERLSAVYATPSQPASTGTGSYVVPSSKADGEEVIATLRSELSRIEALIRNLQVTK